VKREYHQSTDPLKTFFARNKNHLIWFVLGDSLMDKDKKEKLEGKGYEIDSVAKFLGLTPEEEKRIMGMIKEAKLKWIMEK